MRYDNEGNGAEQRAVTPDVNMNQAIRVLNEYTLDRNGISRESNNDLPVADDVVDRYVEEYKANHPLDENRTKYNFPEGQKTTEGPAGNPMVDDIDSIGHNWAVPSANESINDITRTVNSDEEYINAVEKPFLIFYWDTIGAQGKIKTLYFLKYSVPYWRRSRDLNQYFQYQSVCIR